MTRMNVNIESGQTTYDEFTDAMIIIDVLRSFSTTAYLLALPVKKIYLVKNIEEAHEYQNLFPDSVLIGESKGITPTSFDYGNSPSAVKNNADLRNKVIIMSTTNGITALLKEKKCCSVYATSFLNLFATALKMKEKGYKNIKLKPLTFRGEICQADLNCAEMLKKILLEEKCNVQHFINQIYRSKSASVYLKDNNTSFPINDFKMSLEVDRFPFAMRRYSENEKWFLKIEL